MKSLHIVKDRSDKYFQLSGVIIGHLTDSVGPRYCTVEEAKELCRQSRITYICPAPGTELNIKERDISHIKGSPED